MKSIKKKVLSICISICMIIGLMAASAFADSATYDLQKQTIRLGGADRYGTCIAISNEFVKNNPTDRVIIASAFNYPDSLAAAPLTKIYNAPVMITQTAKLTPVIETQLKRMGIKNAIIVGGTSAVSDNVMNRLKAIGIQTERLAGADRYETSMVISERVAQKVIEKNGTVRAMVIATSDYNDVLTLAPVSCDLLAPIILVKGTEKTVSEVPGLQSFMDKYTPTDKSTMSKFKTYFTAGKVADELALQLPNFAPGGGRYNKYVNNLAINDLYSMNLLFSNVLMANGENFPDALCGVALAGKLDAPIVFTGNAIEENDMADNIRTAFLSHYGNTLSVYYLGGTKVVPDGSRNKIQ